MGRPAVRRKRTKISGVLCGGLQTRFGDPAKVNQFRRV
jgi:hypothetical protein